MWSFVIIRMGVCFKNVWRTAKVNKKSFFKWKKMTRNILFFLLNIDKPMILKRDVIKLRIAKSSKVICWFFDEKSPITFRLSVCPFCLYFDYFLTIFNSIFIKGFYFFIFVCLSVCLSCLSDHFSFVFRLFLT